MFYIEIFHGSRGGNAVPGNETIVICVYSPNGKKRVAITMINPPCYYGNLVVRCTGKKRKEKEARNEAGERAWRVNRGYLRRHEFEKVGSVKYEGSIQLKINLTDDPSNPRIARRRGQHGARFPVVHLRVRARFCRMARAWWSINGRLHKSPAR